MKIKYNMALKSDENQDYFSTFEPMIRANIL